MKSLLQECASCRPFRVTNGCGVSSHRSSHRSSLPWKQATNACLQPDGASRDESEEIQRVHRRLGPASGLAPAGHTYTPGSASAAGKGRGGWNRCYLVVMITGQGEYETWKTEGEGRLQLILVKNNCFLLVSAEKITSRREAASGNSLLSSSGRKAC